MTIRFTRTLIKGLNRHVFFVDLLKFFKITDIHCTTIPIYSLETCKVS